VSNPTNISDIWAKLLEEHFLAHKSSKQVFIGAGLPVLPKQLVDKMVAGEYINFNKLANTILRSWHRRGPIHFNFRALATYSQASV
jgi:hypothetical protein